MVSKFGKKTHYFAYFLKKSVTFFSTFVSETTLIQNHKKRNERKGLPNEMNETKRNSRIFRMIRKFLIDAKRKSHA